MTGDRLPWFRGVLRALSARLPAFLRGVLVLAVIFFAAVALRGLAFRAPGVPDLEPSSLVWIGVAAVVWLLLMHVVVVRGSRRQMGRDWADMAVRLGLDRPRAIPMGFVFGIATVVIVVAASALAQPPGSTSDPRDGISTAAAIPALVLFVVLAVPVEEVMFRGLLLLGWRQLPATALGWTSRIGLLVLSSVVFGLWHAGYGSWSAVSAAVAGLLYGTAGVVTRSLWASIAAHTVYNVIAFTAGAVL